MNQRLTGADALRLSSARVSPRRVPDPDSIDLRALGRLFLSRWKTLLGVSLLAALVVYGLLTLSAPVYSATAKVLIDPRRTEVLSGSDIISTREPSQQVINSEIAILTSNVLIEEVINTVGPERIATLSSAPPEAADTLAMEQLVWTVRENLSVWSEADSFVIVVSFTATDPELAAEVTNTLVDTYIARQIETRRMSLGQAAVWLEEQLEILEDRIAQNEETISVMQTESLLNNGSTLENATQQITTLNNQLVAARAERVTAEAQVQQLNELLEKSGLEEASSQISSPTLETLRARARQLRQQDAVWAESVEPDHPRRAAILADLEQVQAEIGAEVRNVIAIRRGEYDVARMREQSLEETVGRMEERIVQISRGDIDLRQLERETEAARRTHEAMLTRLTETRTQERVQSAEATLVERATVPAGPSAPRPKLMGAVAGASAFAICVVALFFGEMTVTTFRTARELEAETGLPVLASLPLVPGRQRKNAFSRFGADPYSGYAERIRHLRTMLLMRDETVISTSVSVLSSVAAEGKTTTALALADMAVRAQRSAIVVDCDMRRTSLQENYHWAMQHDFAGYLRGTCSLSQAIHSPEELAFDVLTSNRPHPDLADELSSLWLQPVIEQLKESYDLVIIDGPPLLAVSDAAIIAKAADKRIYIVEHERTTRNEVRDGLAILADFQLPVDGMVLNKVSGRDAAEYRYG
ncbi:GumC family protein [Histidinibacterium aquaticum]|uniref:non-specific protein-tyrosine kinase n=1 Tax=Histidinibacterium aquaticum TaxID=2613962 RepID=A0A5J5GPD2_9RHOB|nr:polysaccharide biosynthesis tyrosine autokinase [Histidinibacterium aquaticum]KAA9009428.1 polysaccharide biosynthesis tyrosine autokinase [Histidinibacterium aquaticum]